MFLLSFLSLYHRQPLSTRFLECFPLHPDSLLCGISYDLKYNPNTDRLEGNIAATADPMLRRGGVDFEKYVKNIYRVLMSRGMKGCYVYCTDKGTQTYFKNKLSASSQKNSTYKNIDDGISLITDN